MVQSARNSTSTKTRMQTTVYSYSNRPNACVSFTGSLHGFCLIITCLLLLIPSVNGKTYEPITSSLLPLKECYVDSQNVKYREIIMNKGQGCPDDTFYLCGYDADEKYIIEACQPDLTCDPGTTHGFVVEDGKAKLVCRPCDDGWFEPEFSKSSRSSQLPGCSYKHQKSKDISQNLVLFELGTTSHATTWYCDILNGFYEKDGNMFCDDVQTKPCNCVQKTCQKGHLLRPDGWCIRCNSKLDPYNNFRCMLEKRYSSKDSHKKTTDKSIARKHHVPEKDNPQQHKLDKLTDDGVQSPVTTNTNTEKETSDGPSSLVIVMIIITVTVVVCAVLGFIWWYYEIEVGHFLTLIIGRCIRSSQEDEVKKDLQLQEIVKVPQDDAAIGERRPTAETPLNGDSTTTLSRLHKTDEIPQLAESATDPLTRRETGEIPSNDSSAANHLGLQNTWEKPSAAGSATNPLRLSEIGEKPESASSVCGNLIHRENGNKQKRAEAAGCAADNSRPRETEENFLNVDSDTSTEQVNLRETNNNTIQVTGSNKGQVGYRNTHIGDNIRGPVYNYYILPGGSNVPGTEPPPRYETVNEQSEQEVQQMQNLKPEYETTFDGRQSSLEMDHCTGNVSSDWTPSSPIEELARMSFGSGELKDDDDSGVSSPLLSQTYPKQILDDGYHR